MQAQEIRVAIDIGSRQHRVAIGGPDGRVLEEFDLSHDRQGFEGFFDRLESHRRQQGLPIVVAMEGFNGHARPLDRLIQMRDYRLFNVNNLKLARFKEIFPGPAKSDPIDARKILELFQLRDSLPLAKDVLQEVTPVPEENQKLKRLTRRRRQLVNEKTRVVNRIQADLQALCPGLLTITGDVDNRWFLRLLSARDDLTRLPRMQRKSLLKIRGVGEKYANAIQAWQKEAQFAPDIAWAGAMVIDDARRILDLMEQIHGLEAQIEAVSQASELAMRIRTIPGFGPVCGAELAGEIGTLERFTSESSLALYLGMAALDNSSGTYKGSKSPRQVNTRAKAAMMTAAARHYACVDSSKAYYDRKRSEGKTHNQAVRALGRQLVRVIWAMLKHGRDYEIR